MRIVAVAIITAVVGLLAPAVGASTAPVPESVLGVATGQMFRAGWYEDVTAGCETVKDLPAELLGDTTKGSLAFVAGIGPVGVGNTIAVESFGAFMLGTVGAGSALVTGAQVAAASAVGVATFCGTLMGLQWISGEGAYAPSAPAPNYSSFVEAVYGQGLIPCSEIAGFAPTAATNQCMRATSYAALNYLGVWDELQSASYEGSAKVWTKLGFLWVQADLESGSGYRPANQVWDIPGGLQTEAVVELECASAFLCVNKPNKAGRQTSFYGGGTDSRGVRLYGPALSSGAYPERLISRSYCESPAGVVQLFTGLGMFGSSGATIKDSGPLDDLCPDGWLKLTYNLEKEQVSRTYRGASQPLCNVDCQPRGTGDIESLKTWVIPPYVSQNPTLRQCYLDGWTNCEATTTNGVTTVNNNTTQQTTVIVLANPTVKVDDSLRAIDNAIDSVGPTPTTVPVTSPTTVPVTSPTTVPVTTIPTTTIPVDTPTSPPPPPPVDVVTGGAGWGTCMEDQTSGASLDNGWSFAAVASYIVKWAVAPIICAVYWIVVPPDGWAAEWAMLSDSVGELPAFQAFFGAVGSISFEDLGCQPLDFRPQVGNLRFGDASIDFALCDSYPLRLVWFFFIGLGVLGVLYSAVKSVTKMTNSFDKK